MAKAASKKVLGIRFKSKQQNNFFLNLRGEEGIVDCSFHLKSNEYCVRRWEGVMMKM
jgi:hypothetical protein